MRSLTSSRRNRRLPRPGALILAAALLATPGARALAEEQGTIRLGGDYEFRRLDRGDWRECERACDNDPRCKSWSFMGPGALPFAQCRLKDREAPAYPNQCCVSGLKDDLPPSPLPREAAPHTAERPPEPRQLDAVADPSCRHFVDVSMQQSRTALDNRCGFTGPEWSERPDEHAEYCRVSTPTERQNVFEGREGDLARCLAQGRYGGVPGGPAQPPVTFGPGGPGPQSFGRPDLACERYASVSVSQFERARAIGCRVDNDDMPWFAEWRRHYDWCVDRSEAERRSVVDGRQGRLEGCERRRGRF